VSAISWGRIPAIAGIVAIVLMAVGLVLAGSPPAIDASDREIVSYFADDRGLIFTSAYLQGLAVLPFILFVVGFSLLLRRAEGEGGVFGLSTLLAGIGVISAAVLLGAVTAAMAFGAKNYSDEATFRALWNLQAMGYQGLMILMAGFMLASGVAILRTKALSVWLGWGGIVAGGVNLVAAGAFADDGVLAPLGALGWVGFILFMVYAVAASVLMLVGEREPSMSGAAAPAA
jgi:hypothetical protein